jgi:hypothetical protein
MTRGAGRRRDGRSGRGRGGKRSGLAEVLARRSRVILPGSLGRRSAAEAVPSAPPASEGPGSPEAAAERARWAAVHGREWPGALEALSRRARGAGVPVRIGSPELAASAWLAGLGWAGEEIPALRGPSGVVAWVLRVPAGWAAVLRPWIEEDGRLQAAGAPAIVLEESPLAFLPADPPAPHRWPSPDAWRHAAHIVLPGSLAGCVRIPRSPEDLVARLQAVPAPGRSAMPPDRAAQVARDLLEVARAWDSAPGVFWLVERAALGLPEREAAARAAGRGLRLRGVCVQRSSGCAGVEGAGVRRGLDEACGAFGAAALVTERSRAGVFAGPVELAGRVRRRGRLEGAGAAGVGGSIRDLRRSAGIAGAEHRGSPPRGGPVGVRSRAAGGGPALVEGLVAGSFPVAGLACAGSRAGLVAAVDRPPVPVGSGGRQSPFLPLNVIAHTPEAAALHFRPGRTGRAGGRKPQERRRCAGVFQRAGPIGGWPAPVRTREAT